MNRLITVKRYLVPERAPFWCGNHHLVLINGQTISLSDPDISIPNISKNELVYMHPLYILKVLAEEDNNFRVIKIVDGDYEDNDSGNHYHPLTINDTVCLWKNLAFLTGQIVHINPVDRIIYLEI